MDSPPAALAVPVMCSLGTKEGLTVKNDRFAEVWPMMEKFFLSFRGKGALAGMSVDPLTSHECGNQRYLAIPWFNAVLAARLPAKAGDPLQPMSTEGAWLARLGSEKAVPASQFEGEIGSSTWLPNAEICTGMDVIHKRHPSGGHHPPASSEVADRHEW
jgi:hypothetical protein